MGTKEVERRITVKAKNVTNIAYLAADIAHSFCIVAKDETRKAGLAMKHEERHKWSLVWNALHNLKGRLHLLAREFDHLDDALTKEANGYADTYFEIFKLMFDRIGDDMERMNEVTEYLQSLDTRLNLYEDGESTETQET